MRRFLFYSLTFIVGIVLQFSWARYFAPYGLAPNVILVMLIFVGLIHGSFAGELLGFAWGLSWDAMSVDLFGCHAFLFTCIGFAAGKLSRKWNESKIVTQMALTGVASLLYIAGIALVYQVFGSPGNHFQLNYITLLQIFYNMLIAPILFKINLAADAYLSDNELNYD
jgi:rod shape-determining protein MreD